MATHRRGDSRALPEHPNLAHLKDQAKDLLRSGSAKSLTDAQFQTARLYGFPSWPKLKAHVDTLTEVGQFRSAIVRDDVATVEQMLRNKPGLMHQRLDHHGFSAWLFAAEIGRPAIAELLLALGADILEGGDQALIRASYKGNVAMIEFLLGKGIDPNGGGGSGGPPVIAACEGLQPEAVQCLLAHGADPMRRPSPDALTALPMAFRTYMKQCARRHLCLEILIGAGISCRDTPATALMRGRIDLLERHLAHDPQLVSRRLSLSDLSIPEFGGEPFGTVRAPVVGGTLLHLAVEYGEEAVSEWLISHGADIDAPAAVDAEGFGGHTPIYHTCIGDAATKDGRDTRFLLDRGASVAVRASLRYPQRLPDGQQEQRTILDVTPLEYAESFADSPSWVGKEPIRILREYAARGSGR